MRHSLLDFLSNYSKGKLGIFDFRKDINSKWNLWMPTDKLRKKPPYLHKEVVMAPNDIPVQHLYHSAQKSTICIVFYKASKSSIDKGVTTDSLASVMVPHMVPKNSIIGPWKTILFIWCYRSGVWRVLCKLGRISLML